MKFQIYCDDSLSAATVADQSLAAKMAVPDYYSMSRRELQTLAKKNGIKANLKSDDIIEQLGRIAQGQRPKKRSKTVLHDIENVDPKQLNNVRNTKTAAKKKTQAAVSRKTSRRQSVRLQRKVDSGVNVKEDALAALEREKARKMMALAAKEASEEAMLRELDEVAKKDPIGSPYFAQLQQRQPVEVGTQTCDLEQDVVQSDKAMKDDSGFFDLSLDLFVNSIIMDSKMQLDRWKHEKATSAIETKKEQDKACFERARSYLEVAKAGLERQAKLKRELELLRGQTTKTVQQPEPAKTSQPPTTLNSGRCLNESEETLLMSAIKASQRLYICEKENISPGCKVPVKGSSIYFTGGKRKGRGLSVSSNRTSNVSNSRNSLARTPKPN